MHDSCVWLASCVKVWPNVSFDEVATIHVDALLMVTTVSWVIRLQNRNTFIRNSKLAEICIHNNSTTAQLNTHTHTQWNCFNGGQQWWCVVQTSQLICLIWYWPKMSSCTYKRAQWESWPIRKMEWNKCGAEERERKSKRVNYWKFESSMRKC